MHSTGIFLQNGTSRNIETVGNDSRSLGWDPSPRPPVYDPVLLEHELMREGSDGCQIRPAETWKRKNKSERAYFSVCFPPYVWFGVSKLLPTYFANNSSMKMKVILELLMFVCPCVRIIRNRWTTICNFLVYLFLPNLLYMLVPPRPWHRPAAK